MELLHVILQRRMVTKRYSNVMTISPSSDLAGTNEIENAEIYSIIDALEVLWERLVLYFYERDDKKKVYTRLYYIRLC